MRQRVWLAAVVLAFVAAASALPASPGTQAGASTPRLKVSDNKRFLVTAAGQPFFWLGDTAWELFHRLTREEAVRYLRNRADRRFTVIQAVALAELDGLNVPNAYGQGPLLNNDPATPDVRPGADNDYWDHVDFVVRQAAELGLYIGFLPTWGDKWNIRRGAGPEVFTPQNAERYGRWLGARYKDDPNIIWILGGDRPIETDAHRDIIRAMAGGLRAGDAGTHLVTLHPTGGQTSATEFHADDWLDFNMRQNGHVAEYTGRYDQTRTDYERQPTKPVVDGEPLYEDHPVSFDAARLGYSISSDVRRPLYWDLFGGAFGHTYGHHSVWQMWAPGRAPVNSPLMPWFDALDQPGAAQMQHARALLESRPFLTRIPDDTIVVAGPVPNAMPGRGRYHFAGTRDETGRYAMVYAPVGRPFGVRMNVIAGARVTAWWFNPRTGAATRIGTFANTGERTFTPPDPGEMTDWVLVLDDEAQSYGPPGRQAARPVAGGPATDAWRDRFDVSKADLLPTGNNPNLTMQPGRVLKLRHGKDSLTITVLPDTRVVDGVTVGVLEERETTGGQLVEVSRNFFATDGNTGDVYYFGEDVDNYKGGKVVSHDSAWRAGERGARFGLMIPAKPAAGQRYYQEIAPGVAMDRVEVVSIDETVETPAGTFAHCVHLRETTPLEADVSHKYYAPGIGVIKDDEFELAERPSRVPMP